MQTYTSVYRTVTKNALRATWQHRGLWIFGFLAGIAQSGAVTNDVLRLAPKLQQGTLSWSTLEDAWNGLTIVKTFFGALVTGSLTQIIVTLLVSIVVLVAIFFLIVASQHIVLHGVHTSMRRKPHNGLRSITRELQGFHALRIVAVDIILWLSVSIVILGSGMLMRNLIAALPSVSLPIAFGMYLLMLPVLFLLSSVGMLTLVHVIRNNESVRTAFHNSTTFFSKHWLFTLELSAILFLINFAVTGFIAVGLLLFAMLLVVLFAAASSSFTLIVFLFAIAALMLVAGIVCLGGATTVFNYSMWTEFVHSLSTSSPHPRIEHVVSRIFRR